VPDDLAYLLTGDPDEKITWRRRTTSDGKSIFGSRRTIAHLEATNQAARKKYATDMVIFQGAYNSTVPQSAGSHDKDAAVDCYIPNVDWWEMQRFLRELGWAAWYRHTGSFASTLHIHMISLGYSTPVGSLIPGQVSDYYNRRDGLAGHALDDTWHPPDIDSTIFDYPAWKREQEANMPLNDADKKWLRDTIREEARAAVDDVLEVDLNAHEPSTDEKFRGVTLRRALKLIAKKVGAV
jgi:hypothetical protein